MSRWPILVLVTFGFFMASVQPLSAQGVGGPLSPWLSLNNKGGGGVDNFHTFVQPNLQLQNTLQAQQAGIQGNAAALRTESESLVSQRAATLSEPSPTGTAASFMTQGAYFNTNHGGGVAPGPITPAGIRPVSSFSNTALPGGGAISGLGGLGSGM